MRIAQFRLAAALAAAVVPCLVLCGGIQGCGGGEGQRPDDYWGRKVDVGEGILLYEPLENVDSLPGFFIWRTATAASYSLALFDSSGVRLATITGLPAPSYEVDDKLDALVKPGAEYGWQVLAIDGSGQVIDGSPVGRFRIRTAGAP
jgi:hypothetical protein